MSDNEYEWGPWVDHDGRGCPCVGEWVQLEKKSLASIHGWEGVAGSQFDGSEQVTGSSWHWAVVIGSWHPVIRYRIRKPRSKSMDILRALVQDPSLPINAPTGPVRELTPA